ncbi:transcription antitermination factor NusB [Yaniella flava]|uniref:Transcription antitermination protein NusB n=1 Tax=Yaniella flava TaxID=287930 RepID=A0ABP5FYS0_9MICC
MSKKSHDQSRHIGARGRARRRALEILFEAEQRHTTPLAALQRRRDHTDQTINPYTTTIIDGVITHQEQIDELLAQYAHGWTLERMLGMDKSILRLGAWELLFYDGMPDGAAVNEAVNMAREYSNDDSPSYVNGVLGRLQELKPTLIL